MPFEKIDHFREGGEAQTGYLAGNPEMAPMSRTMMPPTFLPQLKPKKKSRKGVGLENLSIFVGTRFLRGGGEGCANPDAVVFGESYFEYVCGPLMPQIHSAELKRTF
jgi:hypothetical protein